MDAVRNEIWIRGVGKQDVLSVTAWDTVPPCKKDPFTGLFSSRSDVSDFAAAKDVYGNNQYWSSTKTLNHKPAPPTVAPDSVLALVLKQVSGEHVGGGGGRVGGIACGGRGACIGCGDGASRQCRGGVWASGLG